MAATLAAPGVLAHRVHARSSHATITNLSYLLAAAKFVLLKRILKLDRLRLRGPTGALDEYLLAATAQNLRRMAKKLFERQQAVSVVPA